MIRDIRFLSALTPFVLLVFFIQVAYSQDAKRSALVIGNGAYTNLPALDNPVSDATDVSAALSALGFDVTLVVDGDHRQMLNSLSTFGRAAMGADVALFFYAGHGLQIAGRNWLLPVSSSIMVETDLPAQAIRMNDIVDVMEVSGAALKLVLLDACRNNPLPKSASRSATRGLARVEATSAGTMIAFATAPGDVATDGAGRNSPFTAALIQHIATEGLEIRQLMGRVRETVYKGTRKQQLPWVNEALIGEFYFAGKDPDAVPIAVLKPQPTAGLETQAIPKPQSAEGPTEKEAFTLARSINTEPAWDVFLNLYPDGAYAAFAVAARDSLNKHAVTQMPVSPIQASAPEKPIQRGDRSYGLIFPDSGSRRISQWELDGLSKAELRIARNEIYARRGRFFKSADLKHHFSRFAWYRPHTWSPALNKNERANVNLIKKVESWR